MGISNKRGRDRLKIGVVGLGAMGSFAFLNLAKKGHDVIGFEKYHLSHDRGSSHGESRMFRTAYGEGVAYVPLLKRAYELWQNLSAETNRELYIETGGLMFGLPNNFFIRTVQKSIQRFRLPHNKWSGTEGKVTFPQFNLQDRQIAIFEQLAGLLKPELSIQTAVEQGVKHGGRAMTDTKVTNIKMNKTGVTVESEKGNYDFDHIVVAVGGWLNHLLPQLKLPISIERQVLVWYEASNPKDFMPGRFPSFARMEAGKGFYGFPTLDEKTVKMALHHGGEIVGHPAEVDRNISEEDVLEINELVTSYFPGIIPEPVKAQTCFYANVPDEHFIVGQHKKAPNITLLGPMSGHGFKFAPVLGEIAAQLAVGEEPAFNIEMFDPNRFKNKQGHQNNIIC